MKNIFSLYFLLFSIVILGQNNLTKSSFNLGNVSLKNEDVVDIQIYNSTKDTLILLKTESNGNASFKYTSKTIKPGYASTFRIKLNAKKTGRLTENIDFYFNNDPEPVRLSLNAKIKKVEKDGLQDCPSFSNYKASVNKNGVYSPAGEIRVGYTKLFKTEEIASVNAVEEKEPIISKEKSNPTQERKIKPEPKAPVINNRRDQPSLGQILFGKTKEEDEDSEEEIEVETPIEEETEITLQEQEPTNPNLLDNSFKPNNVVFLIDASTSMRENEKMDLLKKSMIELLEPLRDQDFLSIVTYSGDAKVILSPTSASNKKEIEEIINNIKADGSTQAVKGIKKAIQVANTSFIPDGNNEILLATDGAFDIGERNKSLRRKISSESKKGLIVTVLGIKNERWTNKSLKEIAELGNGELIKINKPGDTKRVLEEVKSKSQL